MEKVSYCFAYGPCIVSLKRLRQRQSLPLTARKRTSPGDKGSKAQWPSLQRIGSSVVAVLHRNIEPTVFNCTSACCNRVFLIDFSEPVCVKRVIARGPPNVAGAIFRSSNSAAHPGA
jgi:hypothetical protein